MEQNRKTPEQAINAFQIKGTISKSWDGKTKAGLDFHNILVEVRGWKYTDLIPMVAYGEFIIPKVGSQVVVFGRIRSKEFEFKYTPTIIIESIHQIVTDVKIK
jgi:putative aminopeptidase FrvX